MSKITIELSSDGLLQFKVDGKPIGGIFSLTLTSNVDDLNKGLKPQLNLSFADYEQPKKYAELIKQIYPDANIDFIAK